MANSNENNPFSVVDVDGYVMSQSESLERAEDTKWHIEHDGWPYTFKPPLAIVNDIEWEQ